MEKLKPCKKCGRIPSITCIYGTVFIDCECGAYAGFKSHPFPRNNTDYDYTKEKIEAINEWNEMQKEDMNELGN